MSGSRSNSLEKSLESTSATPNRSGRRLQNKPMPDYSGLDQRHAETQECVEDDDSTEGSPMDIRNDQKSMAAEMTELPQSAYIPDPNKTHPLIFKSSSILPEPQAFTYEVARLTSKAFRSSVIATCNADRWSEEHMILYIDSIFQEFKFSSAIYFNVRPHKSTDGSINHQRILLSGDFQLRALQMFISGAVGCHDLLGRMWYFCNGPADKTLRSHARLILPANLKEEFIRKTIQCYEYDNVSKDIERRLRLFLLPPNSVSRPAQAMPTKTSETTHFSSKLASTSMIQNERPSPLTVPFEWNKFAQQMATTYQVGKAFDIPQAESLITILRCCASVLEVGRASSEGRPPAYSNLSVLSTRALTSNLKFDLNQAFKRLTRLITGNGLKIGSRESHEGTGESEKDRKKIANTRRVAIFVLVHQFLKVCNDQQLIAHVNTMIGSLQTKPDRDATVEEVWNQAWYTIQTIQKTKMMNAVQNAELAGGLYPCKTCSEKSNTCDRRHPACGSCSKSGLHCEWPDLTEINRRRTEASCCECKDKHRACDRKRPVCDMCRTRKLDCKWPDVEIVGNVLVPRAALHAQSNEGTQSSGIHSRTPSTGIPGPEKKRKPGSSLTKSAPKKSKVVQTDASSGGSQRIAEPRGRSPSSIRNGTLLPATVKTQQAAREDIRATTPDSVVPSYSSDDEPLIQRQKKHRVLNVPLASRNAGTTTAQSIPQPRVVRTSFKTAPPVTSKDHVSGTAEDDLRVGEGRRMQTSTSMSRSDTTTYCIPAKQPLPSATSTPKTTTTTSEISSQRLAKAIRRSMPPAAEKPQHLRQEHPSIHSFASDKTSSDSVLGPLPPKTYGIVEASDRLRHIDGVGDVLSGTPSRATTLAKSTIPQSSQTTLSVHDSARDGDVLMVNSGNIVKNQSATSVEPSLAVPNSTTSAASTAPCSHCGFSTSNYAFIRCRECQNIFHEACHSKNKRNGNEWTCNKCINQARASPVPAQRSIEPSTAPQTMPIAVPSVQQAVSPTLEKLTTIPVSPITLPSPPFTVLSAVVPSGGPFPNLSVNSSSLPPNTSTKSLQRPVTKPLQRDTNQSLGGVAGMMKALQRKREKREQEERERKERKGEC